MRKINKKKYVRALLFRPMTFIYVGIFVVIMGLIFINIKKEVRKPVATVETPADPFANLNLRAKAVYVYDTEENKVLFEKNARLPLPLASITKLMTVHCALKGKDLNSIVRVPDSVYAYNDGTTSVGNTELWTLGDLASYTLVVSSNAGAEALAKTLGGDTEALECMNSDALSMNLFDMKFNNVTGLDIDAYNAGSYGSAENVATLLQKVYADNGETLGKTMYDNYEITSQNGIIHKAPNTNIAADNIVGFLGSKTGLTDIAGGNLTFIMNAGLDHKIFVAILGSTETERFSDAIIINNAVVKSFLENK